MIKNAIIYSGGEAAPSLPTQGLFTWGGIMHGNGGVTIPLSVVDTGTDWDYVACGDQHSLGIKNGALYSWGYNLSGKTGLNTNVGYTIIPTQVGSETDWYLVSAGFDHSLGIRKTWNTDHYDYTLWSWGEGGLYATGQGSTTDLTVPTQVGTDTDWEWISAGFQWGCAVKGGKLYTCGSNSAYRTGQNTTSGNTTTPTSYDDSTGWTMCSAGYQHGLGIKSGELWAWGESGQYRTGMNNQTDLAVPTQVGVATNWSAVNAGNYHSAAINTSNELFSWGYNFSGRTGQGTTIGYTTVPTKIGSDTDWTSINCNGNISITGLIENTYAIKAGKLMAVGLNSTMQCGQDISTTEFTTFQQIGDGTNYIDIAAGSGFGMAIRKNS